MTRAMAVNDDRSLRFLKNHINQWRLKTEAWAIANYKGYEFNASLEKQVADFREQNILKMATVVGVMQQNELLQKFCLTDSEGQHKNNRNASRKSLPGKVEKGCLKVQRLKM